MKKRILFCGEASFLMTGFATYNREIIQRLYATDKYIIAEFGSYGRSGDERAVKLPWRFYGNLPVNDAEARAYKAGPTNQFGAYKFDAVVADFQPDAILDVRDPWMIEHILKSQFRDNFKVVITPTVDSAPQKDEWVANIYNKADVVTTYSRFGKRTLENQGVNVEDVTSPGVNLDIFRPKDKTEVRGTWGLQKGLKIIGTVMRNQKRKCFPQLFEAYAKLRSRYKNTREIKKSVLLCHTSWPDVGWDIPKLLERTGIMRHVIFTYKCDACDRCFFSWFLPSFGNKGMGKCIFCGEMKAHMPNTHNGVSTEDLADIYNLMDIYVQPAICEGWALPIVEAKACGVPGIYSNYSAMEDHIENGGGLAIEVDAFYTEAETMAVRSLPSVDSMVKEMHYLLTHNNERKRLGEEARECVLDMHTWEATSKKFENIIDNLDIHNRNKTWNRRPLIKIIPPRAPSNLDDASFINWCYQAYLDRPPEQKGFNDWMRGLQSGSSRNDVENYFRNKVNESNTFESIRWNRALEIVGYNPNKSVVLISDTLPGGVV